MCRGNYFSLPCAFFIVKMKKSIKLIPLYFIQFLVFIFLISCKSTETNIYTLPQETGQLVFLRPVTLDDKSFVLRDTSFDMTVIIVDFELTQNNTVNYSIHLPKQYYSHIDKVEFFFQTPESEKIPLEETSIIYKDFDKKKKLEALFQKT